MNGADALVSASRAAGVEVCFANPGTTEMAMVDALTRSKAMRPVLALFEGVASGAADGYARVREARKRDAPSARACTRPPTHNARRSQSPVVTWSAIATWSCHDPPLATDIDAIARHVEVGANDRDARCAAIRRRMPSRQRSPVAGVATLILPADLLKRRCRTDSSRRQQPMTHSAPDSAEAICCRSMDPRSEESAVLRRGTVTDKKGLVDATQLAERGRRVLFEQFPRFASRAGPPVARQARLPAVQARSRLETTTSSSCSAPAFRPLLQLSGDSPSSSRRGSRRDPAEGGRDVHAVLAALCDAMGAAEAKAAMGRTEQTDPDGPLQPQTICQAIAIPSEMPSWSTKASRLPCAVPRANGRRPHIIACKGGSIGYGTPVATGAAVAAPDRRAVARRRRLRDVRCIALTQARKTCARRPSFSPAKISRSPDGAMQSGGSVKARRRPGGSDGRPSTSKRSRRHGRPRAHRARHRVAREALKESFATPGPMLISCAFG